MEENVNFSEGPNADTFDFKFSPKKEDDDQNCDADAEAEYIIYSCNICEIHFTSKQLLKEHMFSAHMKPKITRKSSNSKCHRKKT